MDEFNFRPKKHSKIKDIFLPVLFMVAFLGFTAWVVIAKATPASKDSELALDDLKSQIIENQNISKEALDALNQKPPEHKSNGLTTKTVGNKTLVSEGTLSQEQIDHFSQLSPTKSVGVTPYDVKFSDTTGRFSQLIDPLKKYMATSLLWTTQELPSLHEVRFVNAGPSGWSGMYNGGYMTSGGQVSSVTAYIDLNTYYYQDSPYILEYLQLTLSHEYGHHYTLYNKWLTNNLKFNNRFPDSYYRIRPLSVITTTADYSKGWGNCDAEIIAEDYKYLFSPYKSQQMAGSYGYPSDPETRNYLLSFGRASATVDKTAPTVSLVSPVAGVSLSGSIILSATAADNIAVAGVDFYVNDQLISPASKNGDNWQLTWNTLSQSNGSYSLKAKARDQAGNLAESPAVSVSVNNQTADTSPPVIVITSPADGQTVSSSITFGASVTDNVRVSYANLKIDDTTLASKTLAPYATDINTLNYVNGSHRLSVTASDGINSSSREISVIINNQAAGSDSEKPSVQITAPSASSFDWTSGNLSISAVGSDNVGVVKIELYINDNLVASENRSSISRKWMGAGTPAGSYTLKAKVYDAAGNTGESSVVINKS